MTGIKRSQMAEEDCRSAETRAEAAEAERIAVEKHGESVMSCGNHAEGDHPCDPVDNDDGTATCSECGWTGDLP